MASTPVTIGIHVSKARLDVAARPSGAAWQVPNEEGGISHLIERGVIRAPSAVMVGDRHLDMAAARAHRIRAIGALWGFGDRRELADAGADLLCESPRALAACLARPGG